MRYAETGYNLEVDLSRGMVEKVMTDPKLTERHLGGQGTAAKILWDRVPPEVDPLSPDNLLIFSSGLLLATPVPGANRTSVDTFSPQTGLYSHSLFGGFFGPELKYAGYDKIIFRGKAPGLIYLWIHNDMVEIRDASHLQGMGAQKTALVLKEELKEPHAQVAAIGLAGENRVYMASIEHANSSASRGVGVIMGDKRIKAIVVRGTRDVNVARPAELAEIAIPLYREMYDNKDCGDSMAHGEGDEFHVDNFAWGNARSRRKKFFSKELEQEWLALEKRLRQRWTGCHNCPKDCHQAIHYPGRMPYFQKCYSKLTYAMGSFGDLSFDYDIIGITQEYGLDAYSTPQAIAFAIELYEAGILTDEDLPDFPAPDGETPEGFKIHESRFFYLVEKIARREGIGDILANGISMAARQIGRGAEEYDHNTIKKFEQVPIKLNYVNYPYFLMYATGEKMNITQIEGSFPQMAIADMKEREKFVKNWDAAPERFKKWLLEWEPRTNLPLDAAVHVCDWNETMHYIDDSIGTCAFLSSFRGQFGGRPPYHIHNLPVFITRASGVELDTDTLWEVARRNRNLIRALNIRRGMRRADERPPADHWKRREPETEQKLLDMYYEFKGWSNDGIPTRETLDRLELDYVSEDFIARGILSDE
ncbi:MAG: aldehyde ferredoxin oxidoreductase N-terminal domain-containing protein [Desulfocapsaceae bacterium]|nr:aldehyde ferredoxin oxidoreductase N-terminal domain-containing protein [Desulfocapsaceae bacterium]